MESPNNSNQVFSKDRIAIFHHFLLSHCKGGGEKLMLQLKDHLDCHFYCGSIDQEAWDPLMCQDSFTASLNNTTWGFLLRESHFFGWKYIKRQLAFIFSPKVKKIAKDHDLVILSFGNIAFVPQRLKKYNPNIKLIAYVHTPPRVYTDQYQKTYNNLSWYKKPLFAVFTKFVLFNFKNSLKACDHIITNSENIKDRLQKYCGITADSVIFPLVNTEEFYNLPSQPFFLSHARLEPLKRIDIIVKAFEAMPEQKLVITSGGPMATWVTEYIAEKQIKNIEFLGRVSDQKRGQLMATCKAGIYIPIDEDAGITQLEFAACSKPVIGVKDGGLLESIVDGKTGFLMSKEPTLEELIQTVTNVSTMDTEALKVDCLNQAKLFDKSVFFTKFETVINNV
jgi:glycosyltransferase involved in cell wall biosynthesis